MAFLEMMGVRETIADSLNEYVSVAARLAKDQVFILDVKKTIHTNKHKIFRDKNAVSGLEKFLTGSTKGTARSGIQES